MTQDEFLEMLSETTGPGVVTLGPGPIRLRVDEWDAMAARALRWLYGEMPEGCKTGDLLDVLAAMQWWAGFWLGLEQVEERKVEDYEDGLRQEFQRLPRLLANGDGP